MLLQSLKYDNSQFCKVLTIKYISVKILFSDAANRRYMNFSELYNVGMKFEPKNQGVQYVDIQHDTNSVTFL